MRTSSGKVSIHTIRYQPSIKKSLISGMYIIEISLDGNNRIYHIRLPFNENLFLAENEYIEIHYIESGDTAEVIYITSLSDGTTYLIQHRADTKRRVITALSSILFIILIIISSFTPLGGVLENSLICITLPLIVCGIMLLIPMYQHPTKLQWKTWREIRNKLARTGKLTILRWF
ncbi:hypothetical protein FJU30_14520 [Affinibrenneria salicis]|uniref:Uncharacterized protein n=1 Tax=Affinibrenneria salicis TaxID=2590031 RepID=A0A5J5FYR8_9GAMM|nr:hypothetical protein [Affinibrenneria salicis]KAA8998898.1 hypothetical protein FJU30_14520 [Affinibrenneria salicis]